MNKNKNKKRKLTTKTSTVMVVRGSNTTQVKSKKKKTSRKGVRKANISNPLASLIANPCHGPLTRHLGLGQIIERVRSTYAAVTATEINGYVVWFPGFHNPGSTADFYSANLFQFEAASSATVPTNTSGAPLGTGTINTTGLARADPVAALLGTSTAFTRARTISACLQMEYLGALNATAGQVALIQNMPLRAFTGTASASTTLVAPSVDQIFAYASTRERIQPTGHEVVWRPSDASSVFRTAGNERAATDTTTGFVSTRDSAPWANGKISASATSQSADDDAEIYGVCIAWRAVPASANCITINAVKVVDLELAPSGFAIEPEFISGGPGTMSLFSKATNWLDKYATGWQTHAVNGIYGVAGKLAEAYAPSWVTSVTPSIRGRMPPSIMDIEP